MARATSWALRSSAMIESTRRASSTLRIHGARTRNARGSRPAGARPMPMAFFLAVLAVLLTVAAISIFVPGSPVEGVPRDPSARAARDLLLGRVVPFSGDLRFRSAFFGTPDPATRTHPIDRELLRRAQGLLERAHAAHPLEPRVVAALGHLEFARHHFDRAAAFYRRAIDLRAHCSEARLGLGVVLGLESEGVPDAFRRRALALEALAQFTAIRPESEITAEARFDRAVMLERVGRRGAARALVDRYFARDSSASAMALRRELDDAR